MGFLQKVHTPCLRCNAEVRGYLVPDGRFICPNCDPPAVYAYWSKLWEPYDLSESKILDVPRRPSVYLHLSTLIALMVVTGGLVVANSIEQNGIFGWPFNAHFRSHVVDQWWDPLGLALDSIVALSICGLTVFTTEYLCRRSKKPDAAPPRSASRMHLSTLVTLVMILGAFMLVNFHRVEHVASGVDWWGWPWPMIVHFELGVGRSWEYFYAWNGVALDLYVIAASLFFSFVILEYVIRRRAILIKPKS